MIRLLDRNQLTWWQSNIFIEIIINITRPGDVGTLHIEWQYKNSWFKYAKPPLVIKIYTLILLGW